MRWMESLSARESRPARLTVWSAGQAHLPARLVDGPSRLQSGALVFEGSTQAHNRRQTCKKRGAAGNHLGCLHNEARNRNDLLQRRPHGPPSPKETPANRSSESTVLLLYFEWRHFPRLQQRRTSAEQAGPPYSLSLESISLMNNFVCQNAPPPSLAAKAPGCQPAGARRRRRRTQHERAALLLPPRRSDAAARNSA